jgi:hypothetical protein
MIEYAPVFAMKAQRGSGDIALLILNYATRRRSVVTPRPGHFTLGEKVPITQQTGGWVGPTADLDVLGMRKRRNSNLVATLTKLFRLPYTYHSSFVSKILTSSTTHKKENPGRIHQTCSNFLRKKRKFL